MLPEVITYILKGLTNLLDDGQCPRTISYQFEKMAALLNKENIIIDKMDCKEYYEDGDLSLILTMKNEALANAQYELASKFLILEKELQEEKGSNEYTQLKTEPFFFEYKANRVIFHYNKTRENQRLIANLIEGYNLFHHRKPNRQTAPCW